MRLLTAEPGRVSLRRRFLLILGLALGALTASGVGLWRLRQQGLEERTRVVFEQGDAVNRELASKSVEVGGADALGPAQVEELRRFVAARLAPLVDASAGLCLPSGELVFAETVLPASFRPRLQGPGPHEPGDHEPGAHGPGGSRGHGPSLMMLDRDVIQHACQNYTTSHEEHVRFAGRNDLVFLVMQETPGPWLAWTLARIPNHLGQESERLWTALLGLLGLLTLALVVLTTHSLLVLRRGSDDLRLAFGRLEGDLRADVPLPQAAELAQVAERLRLMATHLAEAHDRERTLERRLGHEQRLAGLGRVVAGVAHEIRNPLAGMKLKLDGMARRHLDERSLRDVGICLQEIGRLDGIVHALLMVARRGPVAKQSVEAGELLRERIAAVRSLAEGAGVKLVGEGQALVPAHREHLVRMLDNLLRNAIEASPRGGQVRAVVTPAPGLVSLRVSDQGVGVPAERVSELFEPFFTLKPEGTGLGLFLSRSLAEAHGGTLVYLRDGGQTHFEITLPVDP